MSVGAAGGEDKPMGEMNTTPLIDVMLVLLIMFIITIPIQTHATKLDLPPPTPSNNPNIKPDFNQINIDFLNTIYWNDEEVTLEQLDTYLKQVGAIQPAESQPELRLKPDQMARYEIVNRVMAIAQQAGIKKMGFVGNEAYA
ncbi:biopolymer transporter ExbD [Sandaracinobacter sp. RS1-74]|uniref:ExbD/TolR family protein n=1 Tax=Sandaracinobacteroides sayramensis TaxID=2913411 RepID=UPI001EDB5B68|nr:biopolymer transporter ExbD [Sandaracinobacteroides sayramensis]MCG2841329.1 biopolymer transporter ExbD [Sandaracinobacteroides sayramensis]